MGNNNQFPRPPPANKSASTQPPQQGGAEDHSKRIQVQQQQLDYVNQIMLKFDTSRTGTLNRQEVRNMCTTIVSEVAPNIGILDSDIDMIMRVGGNNIKAEISVEDIPKALSCVLAIKSENAYFHELFLKHDSDHSGFLPKQQLKSLITEINDGMEPTSHDLDYVMSQFDHFDDTIDGMIKEIEIRAAIMGWYFKSEETKKINLKRQDAQYQQQFYLKLILDTFDTSRTGTLNRQEVKNICIQVAKEITPTIDVLENDIDMIMRVSGSNIKSKGNDMKMKNEITIEDLPLALSCVLTLKSENAYFHELFLKYDSDHTGYLYHSQLKSLITEINNGEIPNDNDLNYVMCQFDQCNNGKINEFEIKAAVMHWYLHVEDIDDKIININNVVDENVGRRRGSFDNGGVINTLKRRQSKKKMNHSKVRQQQLDYVHQIMLKFDKSHTGTLNRQEVSNMCITLVSEVAPNIGILDSDIDMIMRVGGNNIKAEISIEDIPKALSCVLAIKSENAYFHELFLKHDSDHTGFLPKQQLKSLITEINDGMEPTSHDLDYVLQKFDHLGAIFDHAVIHEDEVRAAIIGWYFRTIQSPSSASP